MRKSMRAWVSFHVSPWIRPKKTKVSPMVNSLYNARSCEAKVSLALYMIHD